MDEDSGEREDISVFFLCIVFLSVMVRWKSDEGEGERVTAARTMSVGVTKKE